MLPGWVGASAAGVHRSCPMVRMREEGRLDTNGLQRAPFTSVADTVSSGVRCLVYIPAPVLALSSSSVLFLSVPICRRGPRACPERRVVGSTRRLQRKPVGTAPAEPASEALTALLGPVGAAAADCQGLGSSGCSRPVAGSLSPGGSCGEDVDSVASREVNRRWVGSASRCRRAGPRPCPAAPMGDLVSRPVPLVGTRRQRPLRLAVFTSGCGLGEALPGPWGVHASRQRE